MSSQSQGFIAMAAIDRLQRLSDTVWELPVTFKEDMRVPARLYATEPLIRSMDDAVYDQISNVTTLPGITRQEVFQISI